MKKRALWQVSIETTAEAEEATLELLQRCLGQTAVIYADEETHRREAIVYLPLASPLTAAQRRSLRAGVTVMADGGLEIVPPRVRVRKVPPEDWAESWKRHFQPITIGGALLVKPDWSKRKRRCGEALVVLNPGLSFGTGQHPTTRFCLEQIVAHRPERGAAKSFLDLGTGSGILAIAAAKLGYRPVAAFDNDAAAVAIARVNAERNRVCQRIALRQIDLTRLPVGSARRYDLICANLIYDLLLSERGRILNRLASGGHLVLAGILRAQFPGIRRAYEGAGLRLTASHKEREWASGTFRQ